jgi:hypothetical protein
LIYIYIYIYLHICAFDFDQQVAKRNRDTQLSDFVETEFLDDQVSKMFSLPSNNWDPKFLEDSREFQYRVG